MAVAAALVGAALVGEAIDLGTLGRAHDPAGDGGACQFGRGGQNRRAINEDGRGGRNVRAVLGAEKLRLHPLALFDSFLLTAGCDFCVHSVSTLSSIAAGPNGELSPGA